eukprot:Gb_22175 [translate_table: standard]
MDQGEEQLDYEDEDYGGGGGTGPNRHFQTGGAISALADEEMGEDDEYEDLYHDVNVGFIEQQPTKPQDLGNGRSLLPPPPHPMKEEEVVQEDPKNRTRADEMATEATEKYQGAQSSTAASTGADAAPKDDGGLYGEENGPHTRNGVEGFGATVKAPPGLDVGQRRGGESTSGPAGGRGGTPTSAASTPNRTIPNRDYSSGNDYGARQGGSYSGESSGGGSMLFVGDLHWWTTDADLEAALSEYGRIKYLKFFEEKASGKSKGYCQVLFYDPAAARACKEGMNGRIFNGRPCVVAFANPRTVRQMGDALANKGQISAHQQESQPQTQGRRVMNDGGGRGGGGSYQSGEGGRHYGRMGSGRGQGRGQGGQGRGRGNMGGKNMGGGSSGSGGGGGGHYGQGLLGPMGGQPGGMMHPQGMMGNQGFDPTFAPQMGRGGGGGGYGGFPPHAPPFPGMVPSFPAVGSVGLPGVAPHVNPAFFGRGMNNNGMGMMPSGGGIEGHHGGMWTDPNMGGWGGDGHSRRMGESSYGEDAGSEYGYGEKSHERGGRSSAPRNRERGGESDWVGTSEKRHRNDREMDWDRDRYREKDRDAYRDQRDRERNWEKEDDWGKERAPRSRSKSRTMDEEDQHPTPKEADYGKRRR